MLKMILPTTQMPNHPAAAKSLYVNMGVNVIAKILLMLKTFIIHVSTAHSWLINMLESWNYMLIRRNLPSNISSLRSIILLLNGIRKSGENVHTSIIIFMLLHSILEENFSAGIQNSSITTKLCAHCLSFPTFPYSYLGKYCCISGLISASIAETNWLSAHHCLAGLKSSGSQQT